MTKEVRLEYDGPIATITNDNVEKHNAFDDDMDQQLFAVLAELKERPDVRAVIWRGEGKSFSSGRDVSAIGGGDVELTHHELMARGHRGILQVFDIEAPMIVAMHGWSIGASFQRALLCDIRIAARTATFGYPELPIGIPPSYAAARAVLAPAVARELCLTGRVVDAAEALVLGIVSEVCLDPALMTRALELATEIAALPAAAQRETKRRILLDGQRSWGAMFEEEERVFRAALLEGEPDPAA